MAIKEANTNSKLHQQHLRKWSQYLIASRLAQLQELHLCQHASCAVVNDIEGARAAGRELQVKGAR